MVWTKENRSDYCRNDLRYESDLRGCRMAGNCSSIASTKQSWQTSHCRFAGHFERDFLYCVNWLSVAHAAQGFCAFSECSILFLQMAR